MPENDTLSTSAAENSAIAIPCDKCGESHTDQRQRFPQGATVRGRGSVSPYIAKGTPGRVDGYRPDGRAWFSFNTMGSATTSFCNPDEVLMLVDEEYYATRQDDMMARRRNGESWESIGKSYDMTGTSVKRIVEKGEDELRRVDEWDGEAPPRVRAILKKAGCASVEDARHAIRTGRIRAAWPPNCGQWVIRQICNLINEPVPALDMPLPAVSQQGKEPAIPATETGLPCVFTPERDTEAGQTQHAALKSKIAAADSADDPENDDTPLAHPAWWRGHTAAVLSSAWAINRILDGTDDGAGIAGETWEPVRRRLLALVGAKKMAEGVADQAQMTAQGNAQSCVLPDNVRVR